MSHRQTDRQAALGRPRAQPARSPASPPAKTIHRACRSAPPPRSKKVSEAAQPAQTQHRHTDRQADRQITAKETQHAAPPHSHHPVL
mmetsp:Transcript_30661/g.89153  ORF Transcript_30661/g.89153 Transcript_30661/m.89153 type:complete len:87 (-) Transcript_30661:1283-1543(-)